ncbi:MAG TPA: thiamine pyrophosphate-dependent enzyme, partial [Clostridia bacterium]|nr:thiamine pyrophosphate-dependent enzyme [Clostridia bacterium]
PISSQTEQDTRHFGRYARLPVLDPSSPEEAYAMVFAAFELSEAYRTPVILRPTTRVCHACASVEVGETPPPAPIEGFQKGREWVIFPRLSYENKKRLVAREPVLAEALSASPFNAVEGEGTLGVVCGGISYAYVKEALSILGASCRLLKINTPYPFPEPLAKRFLEGLERVLVVEELDPVLEDALRLLAAERIPIQGKRDGTLPGAGEYTVALVTAALRTFLNVYQETEAEIELPSLPVRPPVLCAGCPHRASFYAVKRAMRGKKAVFCGDIGCYTLGNAAPLDMVDTCLCMGAGITIAQGLQHVEPDAVHFAFVGDSTFFHTGIPGVINAVYNGADMVLAVLDNATTAMTGHQPHPGMGRLASGSPAEKISIVKILEAIGVSSLRRVNPFDLDQAMEAVKAAANEKGVRALVFE